MIVNMPTIVLNKRGDNVSSQKTFFVWKVTDLIVYINCTSTHGEGLNPFDQRGQKSLAQAMFDFFYIYLSFMVVIQDLG